MATQTEQIQAQLSTFRESAHGHRGRFREDSELIKQNDRLSTTGKTDEITSARDKTNAALDSLKQKESEFMAGKRESLRKELFSIGYAPTASDLMAFRDANDRVSRLDVGDDSKALTMYQQAQEVGDKTLVTALVSRAYDTGFDGVLNAHAERSPYDRERIEALAYIDRFEGDLRNQFQAGMDYSHVGER
ncbi:hypothetical protein [Leucobacter japonicus]|uniref:hypothetical protein n=1 Tax=Leucobacter japonicus TaxID=1461259 RepID=UPI0006A790C6|nr:hypothetical protein [Leucobacter japonicus]